MDGNINLFDRIKGWSVFVYRIFKSSFDYYLVAYLLLENWYDAMLIRAGIKVKSRLRPRQTGIDNTISGKLVHVFSKIYYRKTKDSDIVLGYMGRPLVFHYASDYQLVNTITGIKEQFVEDQYEGIDVNGRTVLDIGASIGDSAVYFALKGAKQVIALEPYPYTYKVAKTNIKANNLSNKILLINHACRAKPGSIKINSSFQNNDRNALKYFANGKRIRVTTLRALANGYRLKDAVLKIDCEGYEYEIINNADKKVLRRFSTIVLEYHYGFRNIESKLRESGFNVRHTNPFYVRKIDDKVDVLCGFIYAERI